MMNVKMFERLKKRIQGEPRRFAMEWWFAKVGRTTRSQAEVIRLANAPPCGTVDCMAGETVLMVDGRKKLAILNESAMAGRVSGRAAEILGISTDEAANLFRVANWPSRFARRYISVYNETRPRMKDLRSNAKLACEVIDDFVEKNGWYPRKRIGGHQ